MFFQFQTPFLSRAFALRRLSSDSPRYPIYSHSQRASSAEPASVPEKAADGEESKASSEEKTEDERNRTKSPAAKAEPCPHPKEPAFKQTEPPSSLASPKSECLRDSPLVCEAAFRTLNLFFLLSSADPCKEAEKPSEKGDAGSPREKSEDKENKPGTRRTLQNLKWQRAQKGQQKLCSWRKTSCLFVVSLHGYLLSKHPVFCVTPADDVKSEAALEGRLNGDKDTLDEMDESRKEEKNGFKAKFMFNIADGGFTGEKTPSFSLKREKNGS